MHELRTHLPQPTAAAQPAVQRQMRRLLANALLLLQALLAPGHRSCCTAQLWPGGRPTPRWSWDTLPVAFHGAPKTREFNDTELHTLARFSMVTIEKWCASSQSAQHIY